MSSSALQGHLPASGESAAGRRWSFGSAVLDEGSMQLLVDGQPARLERKPLEVLLYLLHHAGEVVTKDELAENLWPGRILTESVLTRCISLLRQALNDDHRTLVRTVHGYGYRLVADIKVEASTAQSPPVFDFKSGDNPPLRPQWRLVERLGTGGHGEAWLARHEKTKDARVFKFARDQGALASLKREITLYRLLHDSLGAHASIVRIMEWNLEEPPYFLEAEYVEGGNLQTWGDIQGGMSNIPLPVRLDLVAQIAEALAAAHSVGVLHKDLKPSNVLVETQPLPLPPPAEPAPDSIRGGGGKIQIKLCDFGSGGVLDSRRLEALGITRIGFTKTLGPSDTTSGTPLYLAPEVIAGQPFTVQADLYSIGVLLYQMIVGDLHKALALGWELDVEDELFREDIALAAAGNPARRLVNAAQLAERLRTLESRRQARAAARETNERAERAQKMLRELRRTRLIALLLIVLTSAAIASGITAYRARDDAIEATVTAKAVSDFLLDDVLRVDPSVERPKDAWWFESLLNRAATQVDKRFQGQPEAAAKVHWLLGRRYQEIGQLDAATAQYEQAAALFTDRDGHGAEPAFLALDRLMWIYLNSGRVPEALAIAEKLRNYSVSRHVQASLSMLMLRTRVARLQLFAGEYAKGESELRAVLREIPLARADDDTKIFLEQWLGIVLATDVSALTTDASLAEVLSAHTTWILATNVLLEYKDEYRESESLLRESLSVFSKRLGDSVPTAIAQGDLGYVLVVLGSYKEAEDLILKSGDILDAWLPPKHWLRSYRKILLGHLRLEQRRPAEAVAPMQEAVDLCAAGACSPSHREEFRYLLGLAYQQLGRWQDAIEIFRTSLATFEKLHGPDHVGSLRKRVSLADALRRAGKSTEASATLSAIRPQSLSALPPQHQIVAELRRVQGLLLLQEKELKRALAALEESFQIVNHRLGAKHWRTERARDERAQVLAAIAGSQAANSSVGSAGVE